MNLQSCSLYYTMSVFILESTSEWDTWLTRLRDPIGKRVILGRLARLQIGGHWGDAKLVDDGIIEMRVGSGPGYRLYCKRKGKLTVLLL